MINEERVKEMCQGALFEENYEKDCRPMAEYYHRDFIAKERIKSLFTGIFAYILILGLILISSAERLLSTFSSVNYTLMEVLLLVSFLLFMGVYMFVTQIIFQHRYKEGRQKLKGYYGHLKTINGMYDREDKLGQ